LRALPVAVLAIPTETSDFLFFLLIISSDESQSKAQSNLQSLGENKTVTVLKRKFFFHR